MTWSPLSTRRSFRYPLTLAYSVTAAKARASPCSVSLRTTGDVAASATRTRSAAARLVDARRGLIPGLRGAVRAEADDAERPWPAARRRRRCRRTRAGRAASLGARRIFQLSVRLRSTS